MKIGYLRVEVQGQAEWTIIVLPNEKLHNEWHTLPNVKSFGTITKAKDFVTTYFKETE